MYEFPLHRDESLPKARRGSITFLMASRLRTFLVFGLCFLVSFSAARLPAAPRDAEWAEVEKALDSDLPESAIKLLEKLEPAARADQAWAEVAKSTILRVGLAAQKDEDETSAFKVMDTECEKAPDAVKPILRAVQARWLFAYYQGNRYEFSERSAAAAPPGDDIASWDLKRILAEADNRFQSALADKASLQKHPATTFGEIFTKGELGDTYRPTVYDLLAHDALSFYSSEKVAVSRPQDSFEIKATDPALDSADAFLAWKPATTDTTSPKFRALQLFQDLLAFHRDDKDRTAFLHCDLERMRWAGRTAIGPEKATRLDAALRAFIQQNAASPLSADARRDVANSLIANRKLVEAHAIAKAGAETFPDHPFGKLCRDILHDIESPNLEIESESTWTPAGSSLLVQHRNLSHVYFRAYARPWSLNKRTIEEDPTPEEEDDEDDEAEKRFKKLLKDRPAMSWDLPLINNNDYAQGRAEVVAPENLAPGFYWVVASADESFSTENNQLSMALVHVTSISLLARENEKTGQFEGLVTDARTGAPLEGVEVTLAHLNEKENGIVKKSAKSDADGAWRLETKAESVDLIVLAKRGNDRAIVRVWRSGGREDKGQIKYSIVLFTDRALYRPGQTIQFKGIWCRHDESAADYATVAKATTHIQLLDSNDKEIEKLEVTTNEFGSFSGSFTAPSGSVLGAFTLSTPHGSTRIQIEEYKRPEFSCEFLPLEKPSRLGEEVSVKVRATAYTGAPIDGAKVVWRVKREFHRPFWYSRQYTVPSNTSQAAEIAQGQGATSADGTFPITFLAFPDPVMDPNTDPVFNFTIFADITDGTGETRSIQIPLPLAYTTLKARLSCDDWLAAGEKSTIDVFTSTHGGDPWPAEGIVRVHKLKQPETCPRPSPFDDRPEPTRDPGSPPPFSSDPDDWELAEMVAESPVQTSAEEGDKKGKGEATFTLPAGMYRAIFTTKDANGREVKDELGLHVVGADPKVTDFEPPIPFYAGTPNAGVEPGETFTVFWGSGYEEARACIEWFKDGKLLKREWSSPGRTQQPFSWKITEDLRGGFCVRITQMTQHTLESDEVDIEVPWSNKELNLRWEHFTSKLEPGAKETWTAIITGPDGEAAAAEMVATLYDASLDAYAWHGFPGFRLRSDSGTDFDETFNTETDSLQGIFTWDRPERFYFKSGAYRDYSDLFGNAGDPFKSQPMMAVASPPDGDYAITRNAIDSILNTSPNGAAFPMTPGSPARSLEVVGVAGLAMYGNPITAGNRSGDFAVTRAAIDSILNTSIGEVGKGEAKAPAPIAARKNLQETAFFFPHLTSNDKGEVRISFTMPEALTTWKFLGFAHDPKMRSGSLDGAAVTSKDLMVQPNPPRFLREGDALDFTVKITNRSDQAQSGTARFTLTDAATLSDATARLGVTTPEQTFEVPARESRTLSWRVTVPDGAGFLQYKAVASTDKLSDGEEGWLPVIPRRILVTESMTLPIRNTGEKKFSFDKLRASGQSDSLQSQFVHVQAVSQPAWYAVLALPYLMEFPHECAEQTFNRYYANALARHIARSDPKIRWVFDQWKGKPALDSPLLKNQDLKGILIDETPWLAEAKDQSAAWRRVALLFDDNHMDNQIQGTLEKLKAMRHHGGLFPWFDGGQGNEYISLYVATGFARLRALGVETNITMAVEMLPALDREFRERYDNIKEAETLKENHLDFWVAHHLYTRSFFLKDVALKPADQEAFDYFKGQAIKHWASLGSRMSRAHVALALHRLGETEVPKLITRSLKENAIRNEEMGMWWRDSEGDGWWWWQAPIETQAMMIEAFHEIDKDDKAVEDCQVWLIKQKQVQDWKTTKATADAVYAMLLGGKDLLGSDALIEITLGSLKVKPENVEPGTGMYEARFSGPEVKPEFGDITVNKSDKGISWASLHWQYLEDMAKITSHNATPLTLEKTLFLKKNTPRGPELEEVKGPVKVGDELVTRLVLKNNRAMEFIHIKDYRGSGCEPVNVLSGYRWQDGFGYYEVTRDTASHFFVDSLPPGNHVFETSVRVQHAGTYQTGIAEIRCMYAPEFNAHSESVKLEVSR
jgi:hypothetical protein